MRSTLREFLMMWVKSFAQFYFPFIFHFTGVLSSKRFALIYLDIVHTFLVKNGVIYTVFFANCSPCLEKNHLANHKPHSTK